MIHLKFPIPEQDLMNEVIEGLSRERKRLSPRLFYDEKGSRLFERICELEEYYVTRAELGILEARAREIARELGPELAVFELGSGSGAKAGLLLQQLPRETCYCPIDVSLSALRRSAEELRLRLPGIRLLPILGDFGSCMEKLDQVLGTGDRRAVLFLGSTIGNLDPVDAVRLLRRVAAFLGEDAEASLLIGFDLLKDAAVLERAYNDRQGITAAFNLNLLTRLNRELGADFDSAAFAHRAVFNPAHSRIEMHLESRRDQVVKIGRREIRFREGETIHTESSYKYDAPSFERIAEAAGFRLARAWTDPQGYFSVNLLRRAG